MRRFVLVVVAALMLSASAIRSAEAAEQNPAAAFGWGMAAIGTNLGYMPAKFLYAAGGSLVSLIAWGVSAGDSDVALGILQPALSGTWVVTPEMLSGETPILFVGPSYEPENRR
jgi:hypothetical protein